MALNTRETVESLLHTVTINIRGETKGIFAEHRPPHRTENKTLKKLSRLLLLLRLT